MQRCSLVCYYKNRKKNSLIMWGHMDLDRKIRLTSMVWYRKYQLRYIIALWSQQWKMCVSSRLLLKKHLSSFLGLKEMSSKSPCLSSCNDCLAIKSVCVNCMVRGLTSHIPSWRACNTCLAEGLKCNRFLVMAVVTDCEECNKKALLALNSSAKSETLPAELSARWCSPWEES